MKAGTWYLLYRTLDPEMVSRGPWDTRRAEQRVSGFYKFNPPQVRLDERAYEEMRQMDPGLPTWDELLALLDTSAWRQWVHT